MNKYILQYLGPKDVSRTLTAPTVGDHIILVAVQNEIESESMKY